MSSLEPLLRIWGINPDSQRWQEMVKDFEKGQTVFNQVCLYREEVSLH